MKRTPSTMTAADLEAWKERHGYSHATGAEALGVSKRQMTYMLSGELPIPQTVALLCAAIDRERK